MKSHWQTLDKKFAALSLREKWIISLGGVIAAVMLLFTLLIEPQFKALQQQQNELTQLKHSNQRAEGELLTIQAKLNRDPNLALNQELASLLVESQALTVELAEIIDNLISPSEMAILLEQVLQASEGVHLVSLQTLAAEPIATNQETSQYSGYYIHPLRMELTGDYFSIATYLETLENLPVNYYWRNFHYQVESYPKARLVLEVYTLGSRQEFIGG